MKQRVQKIIAQSGLCSRRKAEEFIEQGRVTVNSRRIKLGDQADSDSDTILVDGKPITIEKKIYIALNKPRGYLSAVSDSFKHTVLELLPFQQRVYPIGRLDYDSCGLLLLTNDGTFANKIMHPRHEIEKTYVAKLNGKISKNQLEQLSFGITLEDGMVQCKARQLQLDRVEITLHEGRNKIVKRIFKKMGYYVVFLQRIRIGSVKLGSLAEGKFRYLSQSEVQSFK